MEDEVMEPLMEATVARQGPVHCQGDRSSEPIDGKRCMDVYIECGRVSHDASTHLYRRS